MIAEERLGIQRCGCWRDQAAFLALVTFLQSLRGAQKIRNKDKERNKDENKNKDDDDNGGEVGHIEMWVLA